MTRAIADSRRFDTIGPVDDGSDPAYDAAQPGGTEWRAQKVRMCTEPNILAIWGDDVGVHNISGYSHGIMGYRTPNIDRIAKKGALFTDAYPQQSCTARRASFKIHPDGYSFFLPDFKGEANEGPREQILYFGQGCLRCAWRQVRRSA